MEQHAGRLEEISSQQAISPSRDFSDSVRFARLLAAWRQAQIGPHGGCTSKARRVVDGMAEGQCRYHADARHVISVLLFRLFEPSVGSGDPTPQVLDRYGRAQRGVVAKPNKARDRLQSIR